MMNPDHLWDLGSMDTLRVERVRQRSRQALGLMNRDGMYGDDVGGFDTSEAVDHLGVVNHTSSREHEGGLYAMLQIA
jgi:hypothetical protein